MDLQQKSNDTTIYFYRGDENGVVIETKDYDKSIFRNQYTQALQLIGELSERTREDGGKKEEDIAHPNIIAFCGDRGEGKTSCMMTVRHIIENKNTTAYQQLTVDLPAIELKKFKFLSLIEPSFFDQEHNILELVIGQLFRDFKQYERDERVCGSELYMKVLKLFNKVKKCATLLVSKETNLYDSIEELDELAASMSLRGCLDELIEAYLRLCECKLLVITIDDMDYNWQGAYDMTKMLSKYLSGRHCIIMVSVSIQQLVDVVKTSFENDIQHKDSSIYFDTIAAKYVNKLIPLHFRVEMPKILDLCDMPLRILEKDGSDVAGVDQNSSVKHTIVDLIFKKTRYLFYNSVQNVSLIVPDDLRSLRHLLGMLLSRDDYEKNTKNEEKIRKNRENKRIFQSYLYHTWTQQLNKRDQAFVQRLVSNDQSTANKLVVNYLKDKVDGSVRESSYYKEILSSANYTYNISIGDVFYVLDYIERNAVDRESKLLVFFVKSYYSIMLYSYYDMITESIETLHPQKKATDKEIYKVDSWFYKTNSLQRIVNGSYFTYMPQGVLRTMHNWESVALDSLCIYASDINENLKQLWRDKENYERTGAVFKRSFEAKFRMMELYMLFISRRSYLKYEGKVEIAREKPNPYFVESFGDDVNYYVFDVLAPFVNLINVKFTYDRYEGIAPGLYQYALQNDWSLLRRMMAKVVEDDTNKKKDDLAYQEMRLVSDAVIRNAEVLTMLKERIESLDNAHMDENTPSKMLARFFRLLVQNADTRTYEIVNGGEYRKIGYKFMDVLAQELESTDEDLFNNILFRYTQEQIKTISEQEIDEIFKT